MDNTYRDWKILPAELLNLILKFVVSEQSKVESVDGHSTRSRFYDTIDHSSQLGIKIKTLKLEFHSHTLQESDEVGVSKRLTNLLTKSLPNLVILKKTDLHKCVPALHLLLNSQLKHLKRLQQPNNYEDTVGYENYIKCASMMKDRLEDIYIRWGYSYIGQRQHERINIEFQRLYDNLYQFNYLVDINILIVASDRIQVFEYVVESCRSLKSIKIGFKIPTGQPNQPTGQLNHTLPITKYIPRSTIKSLSVSMYVERNDHNLPWYIMHKFPRLQHLSLSFREDDPVPNFFFFPQLFDYLSTIDEFSVHGLPTTQSDFIETIGSIWEKTAKPGSESLLIYYPDEFPDNVKTILQMVRKVGEGIETTLKNPSHTDFKWRSFMDFLKRNGKYVGTISFDFTLEVPRLDKRIPDNFFYDTLTNCPNIKNLQFNSCLLRDSLHAAAGFDNRFSINELAFQYCSIEPGRLLQLSPLLCKIERLRIFHSSNYNPGNGPDDDYTLLIINMPYTQINRVVFEVEGSKDEFYVMVLVSTDGKCYYYKVVDTGQDHWIQTIKEEEYFVVNRDQHVYIMCLAKPTLETSHF